MSVPLLECLVLLVICNAFSPPRQHSGMARGPSPCAAHQASRRSGPRQQNRWLGTQEGECIARHAHLVEAPVHIDGLWIRVSLALVWPADVVHTGPISCPFRGWHADPNAAVYMGVVGCLLLFLDFLITVPKVGVALPIWLERARRIHVVAHVHRLLAAWTTAAQTSAS